MICKEQTQQVHFLSIIPELVDMMQTIKLNSRKPPREFSPVEEIYVALNIPSVSSNPIFISYVGNTKTSQILFELEMKWARNVHKTKTSIFPFRFSLGVEWWDESKNEKLIPKERCCRFRPIESSMTPTNKIKINAFINKFVSSNPVWASPCLRIIQLPKPKTHPICIAKSIILWFTP